MRTLHRWVSLIAALFLVYVALTGVLLAMDEFAVHLSKLVRPVVQATPLPEERLDRMLTATLNAARAKAPDKALLSIRLRMYADIPEGIVWTDEFTPFAYVFDTRSGRELTPDTLGLSKFVMPWHMHQIVKRMHRGDIFGLSGRVMDVLVALALLTLCVSSIVMYWQLWQARRRTGRKPPFW